MTHMTPERIDALWKQAFDNTEDGGKTSHRFAALLFAEAAAPTVHKSVAETEIDSPAGHCGTIYSEVFLPVGTKLYTTPPAAPVPLTDDQIWRLWWSRHDGCCGLEGKKLGEIPVTKEEFVAIVRSVLSYYGITEKGIKIMDKIG
jgi:hypothetical protein